MGPSVHPVRRARESWAASFWAPTMDKGMWGRGGCTDRLATVVCVTWTPEGARELAQQLLVELPARLAHVEGVATTAFALGMPTTVETAAWLHDIGYSKRLRRTGMHAIDGALYLDLAGAPMEVVSLVAFHTGAEYEADERGLVDQLILFDRPRQDLLDLLILADLVTDPSGCRVDVTERLDEIFARYEPQHPVHRAVTRSWSYLEECAARAAERTGYPMKVSPPATP